MSAGTSFTYFSPDPLSGLQACFPVPPTIFEDWKLRYPLATVDVVISVPPFTDYTPMGLNLLPNATEYDRHFPSPFFFIIQLTFTRACISLVGVENVTYFVAG